MFRNMVTSLFKHEQIQTTDAKAKELRRWADELVTLAKRGDLHARRQAMAIIQEKDVVHKLFEDAPKRFADVNGGYTRVVKIGYRPGDAAAVSVVQLVSPELKKKKKPRRKKKAAPAAETPQVTETMENAIPEAEEAVAAEPGEAEAAPEAPEAKAAAEPVAEAAVEAPDATVEAIAATAPDPEAQDSEKKEEK